MHAFLLCYPESRQKPFMVHHQLDIFVYGSASPPVHMAQMWGGGLLIRLDVCCQSASRPSIYCKSCSVFKAKRNTHSVSQPKPQQHKHHSRQKGPLAKCKLAALPFCVEQQTCHAVWSSGKPQSLVSLG